MNERIEDVIFHIRNMIKGILISTGAFIWGYILFHIIGDIDLQVVFGVELWFLNYVGYIVVWIATSIFLLIPLGINGMNLFRKIKIVRYFFIVAERKEKRKGIDYLLKKKGEM